MALGTRGIGTWVLTPPLPILFGFSALKSPKLGFLVLKSPKNSTVANYTLFGIKWLGLIPLVD